MSEFPDVEPSASDELATVLGDDAELGALAQQHDKLRELAKKYDEAKAEVAKAIVARMEGMGLDSVKAGGRRLSFKKQTYYGCAEGRSQDVKDFVEAVAPELNVPATTNIKKALEVFLDENPGSPIPEFISVNETRSLVNAKA